MRRHLLSVVVSLALAACTARPTPIAVAPPPPVVADPTPVLVGYPGLAMPPRLPDGGYATPNATVSAAGAVWHLRAGLNVAALACRGADEAALIAGYNRLLRAQAASFDRAYRTLGQEYGGVAAFDAAMTRLYNYFALPPAQAGLCAAAGEVLGQLEPLPAGALEAAAPAALARLDRPYLTIFAAQDAWLANRQLAQLTPAGMPRIEVDRAALLRP